MSLEKACAIMNTLRFFYGNRYVDIQGGEPTVYKDILSLIEHCVSIGLKPTLITNGLMLAKTGAVQQYQDAGLRDFLVSLHGVGTVHDEVVGVKGAYVKVEAALDQMQALNVPFRINCTMSKPVAPLLRAVAEKAIAHGALVVNYIAFNPFADQHTGHRHMDTVARYREIIPVLTEAMDLLEASGIEVNVRYLPLCLAEKRHRKNFYNYQQLSYDHHEWDYQSWLWSMMPTQTMREGDMAPPFKLGVGARRLYKANAEYLRDNYKRHSWRTGAKYKAQHFLATMQQWAQGKEALYRKEAIERAAGDCGYQYGAPCDHCHARAICDGFHGDYVEFFGLEEACPITDISITHDPCRFIREQEKVTFLND